jgi:hypothetical protein
MVIAYARVLRERILEEAGGVERGILNGSAKNFEEYRFLIGKKLGLEIALATIDDLLIKFTEQD